MSRNRWLPLRTSGKDRPEKGNLIAYRHAVWRVAKVENIPLSDTDRDVWLKHGMPDLDTWPDRPYRVIVDWVGGARPAWNRDGDMRKHGTITISAGVYIWWRVYPSDRWPQCSCCGEPMPCRAELEDDQVSASLEQVAKFEAIPLGACWACGERITARQKSVTYPGENLDLPGGQQVHFHTRRGCVVKAHEYEERWVAIDPRRERILTWPRCGGILIVHGDGSSECVSGRSALGRECVSEPDCRGHLTHDHGVLKSCLARDRWFGLLSHEEQASDEEWPCPRGCSPVGHPGTSTSPRPSRRRPTVDGLFERSELDQT